MSRYVIIGSGAVGAGLAAEFTAAGIGNVLVGRGPGIAHIAEHGLRYVRPDGIREVRLVTASRPDEVRLTEDDTLVIATKSQDVEAAVQEWAWQPLKFGGRPASAAWLPVLTLQNGLDAERVALRRFDRVYGASLFIPARYTQIGEVVAGSAPIVGVFTISRFPSGTDEQAERIARDLRRAGYAVQLTDNVSAWKAAKLLHSVKNGLEVLTGDPEQVAELSARLAAEAVAVLKAAGYRIADQAAERTIDLTGFGVQPGSGISPGQQSTWQSFARGAGSAETDFLNGEVVLLGRLHGVETPVNRALQLLFGAAAQAGDPPGTHSVSELVINDGARR
jgi:2-dehydropantoate 2-reductase